MARAGQPAAPACTGRCEGLPAKNWEARRRVPCECEADRNVSAREPGLARHEALQRTCEGFWPASEQGLFSFWRPQERGGGAHRSGPSAGARLRSGETPRNGAAASRGWSSGCGDGCVRRGQSFTRRLGTDAHAGLMLYILGRVPRNTSGTTRGRVGEAAIALAAEACERSASTVSAGSVEHVYGRELLVRLRVGKNRGRVVTRRAETKARLKS